MANKNLKGITIEIDGNTTGLSNSLKQVDTVIRSTQAELKNINGLLKFDPTNTTLLAQKQKVLQDAINGTKEKLEKLKDAKEQADKNIASGKESSTSASYRALEREIVATENSLTKLNDELKNNGNAMEDAGKKTSVFGDMLKANLLSTAIQKGIEGLANSMKQISSAIIDIGKQSVSAFADYEQLVGGVDTLFKDSSDTVQKYAQDAYKNAGISANQYMEQITAFSASLNQSLGNDTAKSAEIGNMAINDMADNANKMGTDISSIQNAYQGFAKQNYTMLDNLKLGYGGTKTEMERLLSDAEKLSGQKYDISNLSDVFQAIHVIQEELGITGTTAQEAEQTISGSLNQLSSAWQNLLTGFGNPSADVQELVLNVIASAMTFFDNVMPIIQNVIDGIGQALPTIMEAILEQLPNLLNLAVNIIKQVISTVLNMMPLIVELGVEILVTLIQGIAETMPTFMDSIVQVVFTLIDTIIELLPEIIIAGIDILVALIEGIINAIPKLVEKIPTIIASIVTALTTPEMLARLITASIQLDLALGKGLIQAIPQLIALVPTIIQEIAKSLTNTIISTDWKKLGKDMLNGILNGLLDFGTVVKNTVKKVGNKITGEIKSFFGIKSPSRLMKKEVGQYLAKGISAGMEEEIPNTIVEVDKAMRDLNNGIQASVNPTINPTANTNPLIIQIENFNNARGTDIESLAEELEFYRRNASLAIGGN